MAKKRPKSELGTKPLNSGVTNPDGRSGQFPLVRDFLLLLILGVVVFLIYSNTFESPFHFDDVNNIQQNPGIRLTTLTSKNLIEVGSEVLSSNRPVALFSFAMNHYIHGYDVRGYHAVNIMIHFFTGIFLYFLVKTILSIPSLLPKDERHIWIPFFTALIWAVHPIQTQSVTYIVQRMNSLSAMFYVLSLLLYIKARLATGTWKIRSLYSGCILAGLLSVGSKEITATLPFFIFLFEWYFFQDLSRAWIKKRLLPITGVLILLTFLVLVFLGSHPLEKILSGYQTFDFTLTQRVLTEFRVVIYYISLLVFPYPSRLNLDYDFPLSHSLIDPVTTLLSFVAMVGLIGLAVYLTKKKPLFSFCILWFLGNLVIESSVIALDIIFEHRTYLPSMLVVLMFVMLVYRLKGPKWLGIGILCAITLIFSFWTYERNQIWQDEVTLWRDCVVKSPQKARPHYNLGTSLSAEGKTSKAIHHYLEAIRLKPNYAEAYSNLGVDLMNQGNIQEAILRYLGFALLNLSEFDEAILHFTEALRINPEYAKAHYNWGLALANQSKHKEAIPHFTKALRLNPEDSKSHNNLGAALFRDGKFDEALYHYREAVRIDPEFEEAQINIGITLSKSGKPDMAIKHYSELLHIKPDKAEIHYRLGAVLYEQGRVEQASGHYFEALRIKPDYEEVHYNLGALLYRQGRRQEAIDHYSEALRIKPDFAEAHNNLGIALYRGGKNTDAIDHYVEALRIRPYYAEAHNNLGVALAGLGKMETAASHFVEALRIKPDYAEARRNRDQVFRLMNQAQSK
jgi:tetratricopeptide (TPR) repeat protein